MTRLAASDVVRAPPYCSVSLCAASSICLIVCCAFALITFVEVGRLERTAFSNKLAIGLDVTCPTVGFVTPVRTNLSYASRAGTDSELFTYLMGPPATNFMPSNSLLDIGPIAAFKAAVVEKSANLSRPVRLSSVSPKWFKILMYVSRAVALPMPSPAIKAAVAAGTAPGPVGDVATPAKKAAPAPPPKPPAVSAISGPTSAKSPSVGRGTPKRRTSSSNKVNVPVSGFVKI